MCCISGIALTALCGSEGGSEEVSSKELEEDCAEGRVRDSFFIFL